MSLKVEIYEKDIVRPFYPTPESLRNYKLSFRDQMAGTHYTPSVLFYNSDAAGSHHHDYDQLKESLSKTLSVLYPLAGRLKDGSTIECNDNGVDFVRANVTNYDLADFVGLPKLHLLPQLLPRDPLPMGFDHSQPMLAVQVNKFRCGGTAVAICLWHGVGDGAAVAGFLKTWAAINRGEGGTNDLTIADAAKIFPPRENFDFSSSASAYVSGRNMYRLGKHTSMKRFVFSKQEIEWMRNQHNVSDDHRRTSRVEALSAFIWAALIRATLQANQDLKIHMLIHLVDLRKRMNPPFPSMCLGNILHVCGALWENANAGVVTPQSLVGRIREATVKVTDDYVRKMQPEAEVSKLVSYGDAFKSFTISSLCGFPFRECDFGWGKPVWFVPVAMTSPFEGAYFFDVTDDGGIEVWIVLTHQVMSTLEEDNEFLQHVSFSQIVPELYPLPSHLRETG